MDVQSDHDLQLMNKDFDNSANLTRLYLFYSFSQNINLQVHQTVLTPDHAQIVLDCP